MATRGRNNPQNPYQRIKQLEQEKLKLMMELDKLKQKYHKLSVKLEEERDAASDSTSNAEPEESPKKTGFRLFD